MIIISANRQRLKLYSLILITGFILPMMMHILKAQEQIKPCSVAIIIDDFGNGTPDTKDFVNLEAKFTAAIMPSREYSESDMLQLKAAGKEIILHMPMEPHKGKKSWLGKNALTSDLTDAQIEKNILDSLEQINCAIGINNHMGSKIMEDERVLDILFSIAGQKNLIFVDSKTTPKSKANKFAQKYNVKLYGRDMFIDDKDINKVRANLVKTIKIASAKGFAIAIGHVGPAGGKITARAIKEIYDEYKNKGVRFVTLTELKKISGKAKILTIPKS